jgi:hypothetical protein
MADCLVRPGLDASDDAIYLSLISGRSFPRALSAAEHKLQTMRSLISSCEEYEPDNREGKNHEAGANDQHVSYCWSALGLPGFLRGFDNLLAVLERHDTIPSSVDNNGSNGQSFHRIGRSCGETAGMRRIVSGNLMRRSASFLSKTDGGEKSWVSEEVRCFGCSACHCRSSSCWRCSGITDGVAASISRSGHSHLL